MAIVFISPKAKRRVFFKAAAVLMFLILTVFVLVFLIIASLNKKQAALLQIPPATPDIAINFNIIDSNKVLDLEPFAEMEMPFAYVVEDNNGKKVTGNISAASQEAARNLLEGAGFNVVSIQAMQTGRIEPFVAY